MVMPPPVPVIVLAPPVKLYVPVLPAKLRPVDVPDVVTLPLKLMVWALLPEMSTASAPLAWVITPARRPCACLTPPAPPMGPGAPPTPLNVEPVAPVSGPPAVLNEPLTALSD